MLSMYDLAKESIPYSRKIWQGIKIGGLAIIAETAKLKFTNIVLPATCNDVTVALLAPFHAHSMWAVM